MTSSGVALVSADGVTALVRPNGTSDLHFRPTATGDYYVRVTVFAKDATWAPIATDATLLVFVPKVVVTVDHTETTDPVITADVDVVVDVKDWVQVSAIPFQTDGVDSALVYIPGSDLAGGPLGAPVTLVRAVVQLPDGTEINHNAAKNVLILNGLLDQADLLDDIYTPAVRS